MGEPPKTDEVLKASLLTNLQITHDWLEERGLRFMAKTVSEAADALGIIQPADDAVVERVAGRLIETGARLGVVLHARTARKMAIAALASPQGKKGE